MPDRTLTFRLKERLIWDSSTPAPLPRWLGLHTALPPEVATGVGVGAKARWWAGLSGGAGGDRQAGSAKGVRGGARGRPVEVRGRQVKA